MNTQSIAPNSINILIDGYNLLHQSSVMQSGTGSAWLNQQRIRLLEYLAKALAPIERLATVCVFDAHTDRSPNTTDFVLADIRVRFAHQHHEADDLIEDIIDNHPTPKTLLVVSSDRRIQLAARYRQAQSIPSRDWLDQLQTRAENALEAQHVQGYNIEGYSDPENEKYSQSGSYDVESWSQYLLAEDIIMTSTPENRPQEENSKSLPNNPESAKPAPKRSPKRPSKTSAPSTAPSTGRASKKNLKTKKGIARKDDKLLEDSGIDPKILKRANRKLPENGPIFPEDYFDGIS